MGESKNLKFHIESQDYFGTLATILKLNLELQERMKDNNLGTLKRVYEGIIKDLMILQRGYKIIPLSRVSISFTKIPKEGYEIIVGNMKAVFKPIKK